MGIGLISLIIMTGVLFGVVPMATGQEPPPLPGGPLPPMPSITVVGSGVASARPDTAEVSAAVVTQAVTAANALAQNTVRMDKVLKVVTGLGVPDKDIQTTNISVSPQRRQARPGPHPADIVGYEVSNEVHIKVRDLARLGQLLDALVSEGANTLGGVSFSIADPVPLLDQARTKALADARRKAEVYAAAAGVKLGRVLLIRESTPIARPFGRQVLAASAVPVAPGELELQAGVSVTYAIE